MQSVLPGLDEARTAAMLNDATIVGVYDFEVQASMAYLIMEYVDGLTLTQLIEEYGNDLSLDVAAAVFSSVARALEIAHENQVLHLDIKPDNVLINRQGQVKVTDFGLATLSDAAGFGSASGGTIGYMPPEQMRQENLDARCDEWALASVIYEMLVGENPFLAPDLGSAEAAISNAEIVLPSLCKEGLAAESDDVLFYALDPQREERYDNVTDFAEELERFLGNPVKGQRELAVLVGQANEDFESEEEVAEKVPFFDRFGDRTQAIVERLWSFLSVALLGVVSLGSIEQVGGLASPILWGLLALMVIATLFKPHLGALLSLLALTVSLFANEAYLVGILLLVVSPLWWFFVARKGDGQVNTALSPALFGALGFNQISPLLVGFFLNMKETLINVCMIVLLSLILAGFGSGSLLGWNILALSNFSATDIQGNIIHLLMQASFWVTVLGWFLAAVVVRLFCFRQTRLFAFFGVLIATGLLVGALCLGNWIEQGSWIPAWSTLLTTVGAGGLMSVACALGVPIRSRDWEDE